MSFLAVLLRSKLFLSFFQPLGLFLLKLSTDSRSFIRPPLGLVFNVISVILTRNIRDYCRLVVRKVIIIFFKKFTGAALCRKFVSDNYYLIKIGARISFVILIIRNL
jgi:hypothetical protein